MELLTYETKRLGRATPPSASDFTSANAPPTLRQMGVGQTTTRPSRCHTNQDEVYEGDETFSVVITSITHGPGDRKRCGGQGHDPRRRPAPNRWGSAFGHDVRINETRTGGILRTSNDFFCIDVDRYAEAQDYTVHFSESGTASRGSDYQTAQGTWSSGTGTLTILGSQLRACVSLIIVNDNVFELQQEATFTIESGPGLPDRLRTTGSRSSSRTTTSPPTLEVTAFPGTEGVGRTRETRARTWRTPSSSSNSWVTPLSRTSLTARLST